MIKGIAFDLDGTLIDSAISISNAVNKTCEFYGFKAPALELVKSWIGNGASVLLERAMLFCQTQKDFSISENYPIWLPKFLAFYDEEVQKGSPLFADVLETLKYFKEKGYQLAMVTNKPSRFLPDIIRDLNMNDLFSLILGADDVAVLKPHPAGIFKVLGEFGLYQEELIFVGDSKNDISSAKNAGVNSIGLTYGYNYGEPIANESPTFIAQSFKEIIAIIESIKQ